MADRELRLSTAAAAGIASVEASHQNAVAPALEEDHVDTAALRVSAAAFDRLLAEEIRTRSR